MRLRRRGPWVEVMSAWHVGEGDVLVGGHRVVSVTRDPTTRTVRISTTEPAVADLPHDAVVPVIRS